jgi:hypothetical protein
MKSCFPGWGLLVVLLAGCDSANSPSDPSTNDPTPQPNAALGRVAFEQECGSCHASLDGFDLRAFRFADTSIIRRAVKHVDTATALNIVAYIHTVQSPPIAENAHLFQPGQTTVASDLEFAIALFGRDEWPTGMTTAQLTGIDPRTVRVAVRLPIWSDEGNNLDWMPDQALAPGILDYQGGLAAAAIAGYRAFPTRDNLLRAVNALRVADRAMANPGAPCLLEDTVRVNYHNCFEVRRWTSTLVALHLMRYGIDQNLGGQVHDVWWDVGNAARKSRADKTIPIANPIENWANWMYLGWSFDPSQHASVYTGGGLRQLGLTRHATFIALRSQVARAKNSPSPYDDIANAVNFSPMSWTPAVATFGFQHLVERLQSGDRPRPDQIAQAVMRVNSAVQLASQKSPAAARPGIQALGQQVLSLLGPVP